MIRLIGIASIACLIPLCTLAASCGGADDDGSASGTADSPPDVPGAADPFVGNDGTDDGNGRLPWERLCDRSTCNAPDTSMSRINPDPTRPDIRARSEPFVPMAGRIAAPLSR